MQDIDKVEQTFERGDGNKRICGLCNPLNWALRSSSDYTSV